MNNSIMDRLKACSDREELKQLCTVIRLQIDTLREDFYNKRIGYSKYVFEMDKLGNCRHYANYLCDIFDMERMV